MIFEGLLMRAVSYSFAAPWDQIFIEVPNRKPA